MKKRNHTTVEELLLTDGFLNWYCKTVEKEIQEWNEWITISPEHQRLANKAVEMLLLIRSANENKITEQEIKAETDRFKDTIRAYESRHYERFGNRIKLYQ